MKILHNTFVAWVDLLQKGFAFLFLYFLLTEKMDHSWSEQQGLTDGPA
ncbi:hypothetical protein D922_02663, partial [Enterococcus faecalis 06-MB-DW-09]